MLPEALAAAVSALAPAPGGAAPPITPAGRSVLGRPLVAVHRGRAGSARRVLVVGGLHGDEPAGRRVTRLLARRTPPLGVGLWVVGDLNPDGTRRATRTNARGVDLNRNFPHRWRPAGRRDRYWPGPRAGSEPETRWAMRLVRAVRPHVTIWLHQPYGLVNLTPGADPAVVRRYARRAGLPARRLPRYRGTVAGWQNRTFPGTSAFVVELPAGRPSAAVIRRHAAAVLAVSRGGGAGAKGAVARRAEVRAAAPPPRPRIAWTPIPFGAERRAQMRRYARRHYGLSTHVLRRPRVIVEHVTASATFGSAYNTFAANRRDPELGELPGVCAHFLIDRDGTIHQLVSLRRMCRHTVGLNHRAIGIEHVGLSDADVMGNRAQLRASLRLTRWLRHRHAIRTRDVIGHSESLGSPYHAERVARLRRQTHSDFAAATMRRYRSRLGR